MRDWAEYEDGFGDLESNMWLGLRYLNRLTASANMELHVYLEDFDNVHAYAAYNTFDISDRSDEYRLTVGGYSGNAGDSLFIHTGNRFTTYDNDNYMSASGNCAQRYSGAWWYQNCHSSNLNGLCLNGHHSSYANGVNWASLEGYHYSLKTTILKIRPYI